MARPKAAARAESSEFKGTYAEKMAKAEALVKELDKQFGVGAMQRINKASIPKLDYIPTGMFGVDKYVIQLGGIPRKRITEIFGPPSGGKTTLCLELVANAQKAGMLAAYIDVEHALDLNWAATVGCNVDDMFIAQPDSGEQALTIARACVDSGAFGIVVCDSVDALTPQSQLDGDIGEAHVGDRARLLGQACRILRGSVDRTNTALVFVNQERATIGGMGYGPQSTTSGGKALPYYASLRMRVTRTGSEKEGDEKVSNKTQIEAVKNKVGSPFRKTEVELVFGKGYSKIGSYVDAAVDYGLIKKGGAWFEYKEQKFQGQGSIEEYFEANSAEYAELQAAVLKTYEEM